MNLAASPGRKASAWLANNRAAKVALAFVILVACVFALEVGVRLALPQFDPRGQPEFTWDEDGFAHGQPGHHGRQWKNTGDYDVAVKLNALGLRDDRSLGELKPGDVLALGDSFTFGWGVERAARFTDLLGEKLGVRVFNAGAGGADVSSYFAALSRARALGGQPGRVLISICMENDVWEYAPRATWERSTPGPTRIYDLSSLKLWLARTSTLYAVVTTIVHRAGPLRALAVASGLITPARDADIPLPDEAAIAATADLLVELSEGLDATVLLIPSRGLWLGDQRTAARQAHMLFERALRERGLLTVDPLYEIERAGTPLRYHFDGDGHWNEAGHALAADALAAAMSGARADDGGRADDGARP